MKTFTDQLVKKIKEKNSILCVGIDLQMRYLPPYLKEESFEKTSDPFEAAYHCFADFARRTIDACHAHTPCVKFQSAFFEQYGSWGIKALEESVKYAKEKGLMVILDAKRGDGGDTAQAYARAYLSSVEDPGGKEQVSTYGIDALTVNIQIGEACLDYFLKEMEKSGKGVFALCKTSFKPNSFVENIVGSDNRPVWQKMAEFVAQKGEATAGEKGYWNLGIVSGATYPEEAQTLRKILPKAWFLVPGFGKQGAGAEEAVVAADKEGLGIIVHSAREIIYAYMNNSLAVKSAADLPQGCGFEEITAKAAKTAKEKLNEALAERK